MLLSALMFAATDCKLGLKVSKVAKRVLSGKVISNATKYASKSGVLFIKFVKDSGKKTGDVCADLGEFLSKKFKLVKKKPTPIKSLNIGFEGVSKKMSQKVAHILEKDINENPELLKFLENNPAARECYENICESAFRKDIRCLRYLSYNADKFVEKGFKHGQGKDLIFKDVEGNVTEIFDKSGNLLGKIIGKTDKDGLVIDITEAEKNILANLFPMSNTKYIQGNNHFITDEFGRVSEVYMRYSEELKAAERDKKLIWESRTIKSQYGVDGTQMKRIPKNDDGGHLIPNSCGGSSDALNIVPQNMKVNRGGVWGSSETIGCNAAKNGSVVERTIKIEYPDNNSLRPSRFILEQKINGETDVYGGVASTVIENVFE